MQLNDWLSYIEKFPTGLKNRSLDMVKKVAEKLGVRSFSGKVVVVAGTNGKGSTVVMLESIFLAAGFKTCAYISPHILHYNERIRINGKDISDKILCFAFALVEKARGDTPLSYFEFTALTAFLIFKEEFPDILILEVGLGGRFDAVNILEHDLSIITTISFDHTDILGDTKEEIGYEKGGIMRSMKPLICGENMPESVRLMAKEIQAKPYFLHEDFSYEVRDGIDEDSCWHFSVIGEKVGDILSNFSDLPIPKFQLSNASLVLMAVNLLSRDFNIPKSAIISGLKNAYLKGRNQKVSFTGKEILFDIAHNAESVSNLVLNLVKNRPSGRILGVFGVLLDKDVVSILNPLRSLIDKWYLGAIDNNERSIKVEQLLGYFVGIDVKNYAAFPTIGQSFRQAIAECREKDKIVVFGSSYVVAVCLKLIVTGETNE